MRGRKSNAMRHAHELWLRYKKTRLTMADNTPAHPDVEAQHMYVDALCLLAIQDPAQFEVIVTNKLHPDGTAGRGGEARRLHQLDAGRWPRNRCAYLGRRRRRSWGSS